MKAVGDMRCCYNTEYLYFLNVFKMSLVLYYRRGDPMEELHYYIFYIPCDNGTVT